MSAEKSTNGERNAEVMAKCQNNEKYNGEKMSEILAKEIDKIMVKQQLYGEIKAGIMAKQWDFKMDGIMAKNGRHVSEKTLPNKGEQ